MTYLKKIDFEKLILKKIFSKKNDSLNKNNFEEKRYFKNDF